VQFYTNPIWGTYNQSLKQIAKSAVLFFKFWWFIKNNLVYSKAHGTFFCNMLSSTVIAYKRKIKELILNSFHDYMIEYNKQLQKGIIQKAYKGIMEYMMGLRTHFKNNYPDYTVSGNIYYGYMDMTYFAFTPKFLTDRKLKVTIVFIHEICRFEVWLAAYNKQVQSKYWKLFKESSWNKYNLVPTIKGIDLILEYVIVENPDFSDLNSLTKQIEKSTLKFIREVEDFLFKH
jgi:hypothetical protein